MKIIPRLAIVAIVCSLTVAALPAGSKDGAQVEDKASVRKDLKKKDPNAGPILPNDATAAKDNQAPATTRGAGPGPGLGWIRVANQTPWRVDIYTNKQYLATVSPWGESKSIGRIGPQDLYAKATFSNEDPRTWGPRHINLTEETTWLLRQD